MWPVFEMQATNWNEENDAVGQSLLSRLRIINDMVK